MGLPHCEKILMTHEAFFHEIQACDRASGFGIQQRRAVH